MLIKQEQNKSASLSHIVAKINGLSLSQAYFSIALSQNKTYLKKFSEQRERLKWQYQWLKSHAHHSFIPEVNSPLNSRDGYSYNIIYLEQYRPLSQALHLKNTHSIFNNIIESLKKNIYIQQSPFWEGNLELYLREKFEKNMDLLRKRSRTLDLLITAKNIIINGQSVGNFSMLLKKLNYYVYIKKHYSKPQYKIHGDLTTENILINDNNSFYLIDPIPSRLYSHPVVDLAKLILSTHSQFNKRHSSGIQLIGNAIYAMQNNRNKKLSLELMAMIQRSFPEISNDELIFHQIVHLARILNYSLNRSHEMSLWSIARMFQLGHLFLEPKDLH